MDIRLVEYEDRYAASEAKMWNMSQEYWGGEDTVFTAEMIKDTAKNSTDINSYLAVKEDEVIGVCTLQEFWADKNILYIGFLNVRPDYHGKKIGKKLVLKCVERTVELGKPELDLYTWAGNTRAIPLYKKCGFFWEKRENTIRLINFIPSVLGSEGLREALKNMDWYEDSNRKITTERDGEIIDGLECYEYSWKKEEKKVRMQFERWGHGLRLLETDDYLIKMSIENQNAIYGRKYPVAFEIKNKTSEQLDIEITGINDANISLCMNEKASPEKNAILKGYYSVNENHEQENEFRKYPSVSAVVKINGKEAVFVIGCKSKPPANLKAHLVEEEHLVGEKGKLFIDIVNNLKEKAHFSFELPDDDLLSFDINEFDIELSGNEKTSLCVPYKLNKIGYYEKSLDISVSTEIGDKFSFLSKIGAVFNGITERFMGEDEEKILVFNGKMGISFDKQRHFLTPFGSKNNNQIIFVPPRLGKPYSKEFINTSPESIEFIEHDGISILKIEYKSIDFPGIKVTSMSEVYQNGLIKIYNIVKNTSINKIYDSLSINEGIKAELLNATVPINNNYVTFNDKNLYPDIDILNITENWIYLDNESPLGICWHSSLRVSAGENGLASLEHYPFNSIPGSEFSTQPIYVTCGLFDNWRNLKTFATGSTEKSIKSKSGFSLTVNNGNPFIEGKIPINLKSHYQSDFTGKLKVASANKSVEKKIFAIEKGEMKTGKNCDLKIRNDSIMDTLDFDFEMNTIEFKKSRTVFYKSKNDIEKKTFKKDSLNVFEIKNNKMTFRASPEFGNSLFSLEYEGNEWLESSFPRAAPKSWWNPWVGGLTIYLSRISQASILNEKQECDFFEKEDTLGNNWKGIRLFTGLKNHEIHKGLGIAQYYMTLPGVPILCAFNEFIQNTGSFFDVDMRTLAFLKPGDDFGNSWFELKDLDGNDIRYLAGKCSYEVESDTKTRFGNRERKDKMIFFLDNRGAKLYANSNNEVIISKTIQLLRIPSGESLISKPMFMFFAKHDIEEKSLSDLKNIRFDSTE